MHKQGDVQVKECNRMLAGSGLCGFTQQEIQPIPDLGNGKELFAYRLGGPLFCLQPVCFRLMEVGCLGFSK